MRDDWESRCPLSCKVADCQTACPSRTQDKDTPSNELTRMVKMLMRLHGNRISISLPAVPASELGQSIPRSGSLAREIESHSLCLDGFFHRDNAQHSWIARGAGMPLRRKSFSTSTPL